MCHYCYKKAVGISGLRNPFSGLLINSFGRCAVASHCFTAHTFGVSQPVRLAGGLWLVLVCYGRWLMAGAGLL
jgi:hypothetical protein